MICLAGVVSSACFLHPNPARSFVGQSYYAKCNLIFLNEPPEVYPDWIVFMKDKGDCDSLSRLNPMGPVIFRGTRVTIFHAKNIGAFEAVWIETSHNSILFELHLKKQRIGGFGKTFSKVFSKVPVAEPDANCDDPRTASDVINCYGYPLYRCEKNGGWVYYYSYLGHRILGFHTAWIEIKGNKVISISGEI